MLPMWLVRHFKRVGCAAPNLERGEEMVTSDTIPVKARIRLLTAEEGGRIGPVRGCSRPNHNFFVADGMAIGQIDLPDGLELHPGQSIITSISFFNSPGLEEQLYPGRQWGVQEGERLVGIGTVIEVRSLV